MKTKELTAMRMIAAFIDVALLLATVIAPIFHAPIVLWLYPLFAFAWCDKFRVSMRIPWKEMPACGFVGTFTERSYMQSHPAKNTFKG